MNCSICISWQLWARSADTRSYSAITHFIWRNSTSSSGLWHLIVKTQTLTPHRQDADSDRNPTSIVTDEIPRDFTRFHLNRHRTILMTRTILTDKDDPDDQKYHLNSSFAYQSNWLHRRVRLTTIILNKPEDWEQWIWQLQALVDKRIWAHVDPDNAAPQRGLLQEPPHPKVTDFNENATSYA